LGKPLLHDGKSKAGAQSRSPTDLDLRGPISKGRKTMHRRPTRTLTTTALLCLAMALAAGNARAQEKQHVSFKASAENSKYPQQLVLDVGDVPDHIVRAFEVHFTYPNDPPVINGLKVVEAWGRGLADYTDGNGSNIVYNVIVMENGDKIFTRLTGVAWKAKPTDKPSATQVGYITGATGKFAGMQGIVRISSNFDYKVGYIVSQFDIDYSIAK
jgi:hypothetical protein